MYVTFIDRVWRSKELFMDFTQFGKTIIFFGVMLIALGAALTLAGKIPFLGRLPGDIYIQKKNFSFYFPLTTCLLISAVLSLIFFLWSRIR